MNAPRIYTGPLSSYEAMAQGVNTKTPKAGGVRGRSIGGETEAPAFQVSEVFNYQSYFDDTLLENALLPQPGGSPIVPSTLKASTASGYAIGLHPSSQTPVAVVMQTGAQQGASQAFIMKPGDVIRPQGSPNGQPGSFGGFLWGLPFGWLGGGVATLVIMRTPDAEVFWTANPEIIFHRQRMQIYPIASAPAAGAVPLNWPMRFPWPNARYGANTIAQGGKSFLGVSPTRTSFRLRLNALAASADMRVGFVGSNEFGINNTTAIPAATLTDVAFVDMTWGSYAALVAAPGAYYPVQELTGPQARIACDLGGVVLIALGAALDSQYVDVVRYGTL